MAISALYSASTGLSALSTRLDVLSNNLANVNTDGFKASRVNFQDLMYVEKAQPGVENANGDQRPTGLYVGLGVKASGTQVNFAQGGLLNTGRELDIAIEGRGFIEVEVDAEVAPGGVAYTRAGALAMNADGELVLASDEGRRLTGGFTIPNEAQAISIGSDGRVHVKIPGQEEPQLVGQIELTGFINPSGLEQIGANLYAASGASGPAVTGEPNTGGLGQIRQKFLESSNVNPTIELVELIRTQRAFEMNSQSIRAADDVLQTVAQLRR